MKKITITKTKRGSIIAIIVLTVVIINLLRYFGVSLKFSHLFGGLISGFGIKELIIGMVIGIIIGLTHNSQKK